MDNTGRLNSRGQITIEAILILGLFILLFIAVTFDTGLKVQEYSNDVAIAAEARANLDKIADSIMVVRAGGPGTTRTVTITSSYNNWGIATGSGFGREATIIYGIGFNSSAPIPEEMNATSFGGRYWGTIGRDISGVNSGTTITAITGNGTGTWKIRIRYNTPAGLTPTVALAPSWPTIPTPGQTIDITLS